MGIFGGFRKKENKEPEPAITKTKGKEYKIGDRIGGRYEIHRILGGEEGHGGVKSGMGIVYVCYDHEAKSVLALKTFQDQFLSNKKTRDSFKKEALAWTNLERHPYIVRALLVDKLDYRLFVACEFIAPDGQGRNTLTHYLKSRISLKQALSWSIQFCYGMEHARSKGVTPHRDIKPDNLMVTSDGTLKLTDFGLAGLWAEAELPAELEESVGENRRGFTFIRAAGGKIAAGTPPWMAPEQFYGNADVRSDIYGFGIVMYQMVNREHHLNLMRLPFWPKKGDGWVTAHERYPVPEVDSKLYPVIEKCLRKKPEERYGGNSAESGFAELRRNLEQLYGEETGKQPPSPPDKIKLEASEHNNKGISLGNLGLFDDAIKEYKEALRIDPELEEAYANMGNALFGKGLLDEAIKEYKEALKINPELAKAYANMGNAYADKGLTDDAIKEYKEALRINPEYAAAHTNLGSTFAKKGMVDEAIKEYKEALRINPEYAEAHSNLGVAYVDKGLTDDAIKEFQQTLRINPDLAQAHTNLGLAFSKQGMLDEAISAYREAIRINPEDAKVHSNLGNAYAGKGLTDDAIKEWKEALRINPEDAGVHDILGLAYAGKGLTDDAIKEYKEVLRINPEDAGAHTNLGLAFYDKGMPDEAIKEYKEALRINPELAEVHNNLGGAFYDKGMLDEAIKEYKGALRINPEYAGAHFNLGLAFSKQGLLDDAISAYREVIRINPENAEAHSNLGIAFSKQGLIDEAISAYREAIRINPEDAETHYNLGNAFLKQSLVDDAIKSYENFITYAPPQYAGHVEGIRNIINQLSQLKQQGG